MAQILKQDQYDRLLAAAESVFAKSGYDDATIASIARRADMSTGNVYRYFVNKEALFAAVIPEEFRKAFFRLLKRRVGSLLVSQSLTSLDAGAEQSASDLLAFWIQNRLKVVILLDRSKGSRYAAVGTDFVDELVSATARKLCASTGRRSLLATDQVVLHNIFQNTRRTLVSILERFSSASEIRAAMEAFWSYQLAGLAGFSKWVKS